MAARAGRIGINTCAAVLVLVLQGCAPSFPHNPDLDAELAERSKSEGLGMFTTDPTSGTLPITYFDHRWVQIPCCGRVTQSWVLPGGRELITVDPQIAPMISALASGNADRIVSLAKAGNVTMFDLHGAERRRYPIRINEASFLAVSPDGNRIAFQGPRGLFYGLVDSADLNAAYVLPNPVKRSVNDPERPHSISWSPDSSEIAYGRDGVLFVYSLREKASRRLTAGANPFWAPDGQWISYRGPHGEAMLIDPAGKTQRQILQGQKIQYGLHWSPDGRYLLLALLNEHGMVPWASLAIYRLRDGAVTSFDPPGDSNLDDWGKDWERMGPRRE